MNTRQIQLYCAKDDYYELNKYFEEKKILVSAMPLNGFELRPIKIYQHEIQDWNRVLLNKSESNIIIEEIESSIENKMVFTPNVMISEVITFDRCYISDTEKEIIGGNLSGVTRYLENNIVIYKDEEFLAWLNSFYQWIRKNFVSVKIDSIPQKVYISATIKQLIEEGYILK